MSNISAETLPAALYRDPKVYERERTHVFARAWLLIAHDSQLAAAGDTMAATVAGYPLVLVRHGDGTIRAFHNVCRHRAGPLAPDGSGRCEGAFVCRYHGWRYALDGRLASARDFGPAEGFDPRDYALFPLKCESWRGFVFVNLDADSTPLARMIAPLAERAREMDLESFRFVRQSVHELQCNWKTYVENYLEGYHIPLVHPPLNAAVDASRYEVELHGPVVFHHAPPRDGAAMAGLWAWFWPCLAVNVYPHGLMLERIWPLDHARTRLDYLYFFDRSVSEAEMERSIASSEVTTGEDLHITEAVQRNLDAGIYTSGRLSPKHEHGVGWFQQELKSALK